jgi:nucleoside-diphosphate-sugar epimerase
MNQTETSQDMTCSKPKLLISGAGSGFGRYLLEITGGTRFIRGVHPLRYEEVDTIIHCAWGKPDNNANFNYIKSAELLAADLISIPHKKFIFISSVDVYPRGTDGIEDTELRARDILGIYGLTKFFIEKQVLQEAQNPLIIRPSSLLGEYTNNNIVKFLKGMKMNISYESEMNFITYEQVAYLALGSTYNGIVNAVGKGNVFLKDILEPLSNLEGEYTYNVGKLSEKKMELITGTSHTSLDNFISWYGTVGHKYE